MDGSKIFTYGLIGVGGWLLYQHFNAPASGAAPSPAGPVPGSAAGSGGSSAPPAAPPAASAPPPVAFNSLDAIFRRLSAAAGSAPQTADSFDFYLNRELPAGMAAPDPLSVFNASGGWDRTVPMTLANYWGAIAPYLRANLGLSGLGFYGGLGVYLAAGGR